MATMYKENPYYEEGYNDFLSGHTDTSNPYSGINAEYWADGWEDAQEDETQRIDRSNKEYADSITTDEISKQQALQAKALGVKNN